MGAQGSHRAAVGQQPDAVVAGHRWTRLGVGTRPLHRPRCRRGRRPGGVGTEALHQRRRSAVGCRTTPPWGAGLAYVAFAAEPVTRAERAAAAHSVAAAEFTYKQQAFVALVLTHYVKQGVDELDAEKLSPLLQLKYRALNDAFAELGKPDQLRRVFVGFQRPPVRHWTDVRDFRGQRTPVQPGAGVVPV